MHMTETAKVTVSFSQKISEAPYETADYSLIIERSVPESMGEEAILVEANAMFAEVKAEVLKQAGQEIDLSPDGVVMRRLKSGVSRPDGNQPAAASKAAPSSTPTAPKASAPSGGKVTGRVYQRTPLCVGKQAAERQAGWNLIAFHPAEWRDAESGDAIEVYKVKENAAGVTDQTNRGTYYPNFSISKGALERLGIEVKQDFGMWVNDGDSNVPLHVFDQAAGQTADDAVAWDWLTRRQELHS
jgi:hypothetical protein